MVVTKRLQHNIDRNDGNFYSVSENYRDDAFYEDEIEQASNYGDRNCTILYKTDDITIIKQTSVEDTIEIICLVYKVR